MEGYIIGNFVINGTLLAIAVFFIRHWMNLVEDRARANAMQIKENDVQTRKHLAEVTARTTREIKEAIKENRVEYREQSGEIKVSIDKLSAHVSIQNGRVGKLEMALSEQVAACKIRQTQHRKEDV